MSYYSRDGNILIRRHWMILVFNYLRFVFLISISVLLYFLTITYKQHLNYSLVEFIIFPLILLIVHYAFFYLIFRLIRYYNNLILLKKDNMIIIKTSLIEFDNIEVIELDKVTKIDTQMNGIIQNLLSYGTLIIEQNRDRVREFHYILKPYKAVRHLKEIKKQKGEKIEMG